MRNHNHRNRTSFPEGFRQKSQVIKEIQNRFYTFGYDPIETPLFEDYDMYSNVQGTVVQDDMLKVIHPSGKVLVLRPDATIPITRQYVETEMKSYFQRFSYVLDIFRYHDKESQQSYRTQAGVEFFGEASPEADAEIIALAIDSLQDLKISPFKIEIGHAGIYKELLAQAELTKQEQLTLDAYIQSKNVSEIASFLDKLSLDEALKKRIELIPMLYGDPLSVIENAGALVANKKMQAVVDTLYEVYALLKDYQMEEYITINLGLINNMNYYSGIIFQGFVDQIGQPILMGGRYDHLSHQFNQMIPAVGFAFEVDKLLTAIDQEAEIKPAEIIIQYQTECRKDAFHLAKQLRSQQSKVIVEPIHSSPDKEATGTILLKPDKSIFKDNEKELSFSTVEEVNQFFLGGEQKE